MILMAWWPWLLGGSATLYLLTRKPATTTTARKTTAKATVPKPPTTAQLATMDTYFRTKYPKMIDYIYYRDTGDIGVATANPAVHGGVEEFVQSWKTWYARALKA